MYVWNQHAGACYGNTIGGNAVDFTNAKGARNAAWDSGNCGTVNGWNRNDWDADLQSLDCVLD
jgi:hypothetical protein